MTSRFDQTTEELTPEPMEVYLSYDRCPEHGFYYINTPRDAGSDETPRYKCPLKNCQFANSMS